MKAVLSGVGGGFRKPIFWLSIFLGWVNSKISSQTHDKHCKRHRRVTLIVNLIATGFIIGAFFFFYNIIDLSFLL
jgi:hypothetical protein